MDFLELFGVYPYIDDLSGLRPYHPDDNVACTQAGYRGVHCINRGFCSLSLALLDKLPECTFAGRAGGFSWKQDIYYFT